MTLRRISPSRVIDMYRWIPGIKYLDSWLSQHERRLSAGIGSGSDRELFLANMLAEIEEVAAYASCSSGLERRIIGSKPNLKKVESVYYRSNSYTCLFNDGQDRSLRSNSGSELQVVQAYLSMHIYLTEKANITYRL
jgi:hypothetical protein